jgi:hypothetical protein
MTIYGCTGSIFNYVKIPQVEAKLQQKQPDSVAPNGFSEFLKQNNEKKKAAALECISNKIKFGKRLTRDEMEFLKIHNPDLYARAVKIENEREEHRRALRSCKTKEEARNLHIAKAFQPKMDSDVKMALFDEYIEFVKSGEYEELPNERELDDADENENEHKLKNKLIKNYKMQKHEIKDAYIYLPNLQKEEKADFSIAATGKFLPSLECS